MQTFSLYTEREIKVEPARKHVKLDYYPGEKNAPAVLILPGGAITASALPHGIPRPYRTWQEPCSL